MPDNWASKSQVPIPQVVAATFHKIVTQDMWKKERICIYSVNSFPSLIFVPCVEKENIPFVLRRVDTKKNAKVGKCWLLPHFYPAFWKYEGAQAKIVVYYTRNE